MDTSLRQQARAPNAFIGGRIRAARKLRNFTMQELAAEIGLTFQQVQKYENSTNRVSACMLARIAEVLSLDISFFFPAGMAPIGRSELEAIRRDLEAGLAAAETTITVLTSLRDRLATAIDHLRAEAPMA